MVPLPSESLILASASPRRRQLLGAAGLQFEVIPSDVPEDALPGEEPERYVARVARDKCRAVLELVRAAGDLRPVLAADTVVVVDRAIIGKPLDRDDARAMLQTLSGREHVVLTGFYICAADDRITEQVVATRVRFRSLDQAEVEAYLDAGEWQDKAGAYAIQGGAAKMVLAINGSYTNVVGLPVAEVVVALRAAQPAKAKTDD